MYCDKGTFRNPGSTALTGDGLHVANMLCNDGFEAEGEVRLLAAEIYGSLVCSGGKFRNPESNALTGDGLQIKTDIFCDEGFEADGLVSLANGSEPPHTAEDDWMR